MVMVVCNDPGKWDLNKRDCVVMLPVLSLIRHDRTRVTEK
jgi:hypothetical protein